MYTYINTKESTTHTENHTVAEELESWTRVWKMTRSTWRILSLLAWHHALHYQKRIPQRLAMAFKQEAKNRLLGIRIHGIASWFRAAAVKDFMASFPYRHHHWNWHSGQGRNWWTISIRNFLCQEAVRLIFLRWCQAAENIPHGWNFNFVCCLAWVSFCMGFIEAWISKCGRHGWQP